MRKRVWLAGILAGSILLSACGRNEKDKAQEKKDDLAQNSQEQTQQQTPEETPAPDPAQPPETAENKAAPQELAAVSTALHDWDEGRMENLRLACQAVHGAVIPAGGSFSFNEALGERTEEKGYHPAIAFENGEKVMEVGGGVCQVSTTLFLAAQQGGMEILERHPHQLPVPYAGEGQDAAVEYGSLDFRFQNPTASPVEIGCWLTGDSVIVSLTVR